MTSWRWLTGGALLLLACGDAGPETVLEIEAPASSEVTVGDLLQLTATASGEVGVLTWTSNAPQVATVAGGTVEALRPGAVTIGVSGRGAVPDELPLTVVLRPGGYTTDEIDYFGDIAFGAEFGGAVPLLRRWHTDAPPRIRINGSPTDGDLEVLDSVVAEINWLAPFDIELVEDAPSVEMHFVPEVSFPDILAEAPPGNIGLVWVWWGADQHIFQSVVLIASDVSADRRAHIIREEITQMLGLLQDSFRYPESIFYQSFSTVTEYLPIDRAVIDLLHRPELTVGSSEAAAKRVARLLLKDGGVAAPWRSAAGAGPLALAVDANGRGAEATPPDAAALRPGSAGGGALSSSGSALRSAPSGGYR